MSQLFWAALGLVLVFEGLVLALLPARLEQLLLALAQIAPGTRRLVGLIAMACGTALIWAMRTGGAGPV